MTESEKGTQIAAVPLAEPPAAGKLLRGLAKASYPLLALFCLCLWLPGVVSLPALDRDESRFAQSSRQMLESGDFVDIRLGHVPRYKKPVGIYWLQAATTAAASPFAGLTHIWTYRLASLLGAILAVWLTVWCARGVAGPEAAFLAGALMAGTVLLTAEATIATTDAVQLAAILWMQGVLLRVYRAARDAGAPQPSTGLVLGGWAALAIGVLVKGPVAPAVAAVTLITLCVWDWWAHRPGKISSAEIAPAAEPVPAAEPAPAPESTKADLPSGPASRENWRWLLRFKPLLGAAVLLVIVLPWLIAITLASHGTFFQQSLGNDFAAKLAGGQESHGAWPGYFLILSTLSFWPAILFAAPAILHGVARRAEPGVRFLLVWAGASWVMFELVPTKLPHYVLPAYPALAILAALWLTGTRGTLRWERIARWVAAVQFLIGVVALVAVIVLAPIFYGTGDDWRLWTAAGVGAVVALTALGLFLSDKRGWAVAAALAATLILVPALTAVAGPRLDQFWVTTRLAMAVARDAGPGEPPPILAGYEEPSMLFALGADTALSDGAGAADLGADRGGLALVERHERSAFLARLAERQADATALDTVTGFDYSRGKKVAVTIYRVTRIDTQGAPRP